MFDVLVFLLEEYQDLDTCPERDDLSRHLSAAGFEEEDIDDALNWLDSLSELGEEAYAGANEGASLRLYAEAEIKRLPTSVRGLLQFLEEEGGLTPAQRELTIDRLLALPDDEISVQAAKLVALMVLWSQKAELPFLIGEDLLAVIHGEPTMQ